MRLTEKHIKHLKPFRKLDMEPENQYLFVFGRDAKLSLAELTMYFLGDAKARIRGVSPYGAVISFSKEIDPSKIIKELGGTTKIAKVIGETGEEIEQIISKKALETPDNRITFGISKYQGWGTSTLREQIKDAYRRYKIKAQQKQPRNKRHFTPREIRERLVEYIQFRRYVCITEAVTDSSEYEERDEKRPEFEGRKATSIRLSKIMINLSGAKEGDTLLDPFCGTGTILQEATLRGIKGIGVDLKISQAKKNMEWISKKNKIDVKLYEGRSQEVSKIIKEKIDVVVTEPYLGPYMKTNPTLNEGEKIVKNLRRMYEETLKSLHPLVKKRVCIIVPQIRTKDKILGIGFPKILKRANYSEEKMIRQPILIPGRVIDRLIFVISPE